MTIKSIIAGTLFLSLWGCGETSKKTSVPVDEPMASIDVPFTSQAPEGNWSEPWKNACEETSIYMVSSFYENDPIKREEAVKKIKEILEVKNEKFSVSKDESLETISRLITELELPWTTELIKNPTVEDLKKELAEGRPIIVPVYAPSLNNPYYGPEEPDYHVLVLTGYDDAEDVFIVNDPGTKNGQGLRFSYEIFMSAIHDLDAKEVTKGTKAVLFTKEQDWGPWMDR